MDINISMERAMASIASTAGRFYLKSRAGRHFISAFAPALREKAKVREGFEDQGIHIPPFLIASISSQCNLFCAGCYARAGGMCGNQAREPEMETEDWQRIFQEAEKLGISFILLAGGEPLLRREIVTLAASFPSIGFPVFTNATLIDEEYLKFFDENRNVIPVISVEGNSEDTDSRRGAGVAKTIATAMAELKKRKTLFGASVTVTTENLHTVSDKTHLESLREKGCGIVFYVEYVPAEEGTEHLILSEENSLLLNRRMAELKSRYKDMSLLAFPGDEVEMGGCLAAGRGFFHINPQGCGEPCPFSPYAAVNLKDTAILEALQSPFFRQVREIAQREAGSLGGGCTLFQHKAEVEALLSQGR